MKLLHLFHSRNKSLSSIPDANNGTLNLSVFDPISKFSPYVLNIAFSTAWPFKLVAMPRSWLHSSMDPKWNSAPHATMDKKSVWFYGFKTSKASEEPRGSINKGHNEACTCCYEPQTTRPVWILVSYNVIPYQFQIYVQSPYVVLWSHFHVIFLTSLSAYPFYGDWITTAHVSVTNTCLIL